jgi:hypothetical protein
MGNHEPNLHRAIDAVAARMTADDAPADLGARVLDRIRGRRSPMWMWALKPAAALAVLAVAAITAQVMRTSRSVDQRQPAAEHLATSSATSTSAVAVPNLDRTPSRPARPNPAPAKPRMSAAEAAWHERAIPALDAIAALSIDGIQPEPLSIPQLDVKALATAPLVVPTDGKGVR